MRSGRPPGDDAGGRGSKSGNSDPLQGLRALEASSGGARSGRSGGARSGGGPLANEGGLRELGDRIDRRGSGGRHGRSKFRSGRKKWSLRRKILTALSSVVILALVAVGVGYWYVRYEWDQVKKIVCTSCVAPASGAPYNVLIVGSDSRAGDTGASAQSFGNTTLVPGQRSDTLKILHVEPKTGTAELLSIPRDTYVTMSGLPASSGLTGAEKINTAFNDGPNPLAETITNTFGIPLSHFVVVDFTGLINAVNSVGGINLDFNYPVRDNDDGNNNSGLDITATGCQNLNGNEALALARSRYYEYDGPDGWEYDPTSDLGRITRQNAIIESLISKAKSTYNPLTLRAFISSVVQDIEVDTSMSFDDIYALVERYHAFSPSSLQTFTLPTYSAVTPGGSDIEVVQEPEAQQMIQPFLGAAPSTPTTPPLDEYGDAIQVPSVTTPTVGPQGSGAPPSSSGSTSTTTTQPALPSYDPTPC